jgi:hypothetical protein
LEKHTDVKPKTGISAKWHLLYATVVIVSGALLFRYIDHVDPKMTERTPAQLAAAAKITKQIDEEDLRAQYLVSVLRKSVNDPDSPVLDDVFTKSKPLVACINYRARNGFGGMVRSNIMLLNYIPSQSSQLWNKYCVGKGFHVIDPWIFSWVK